MGKFSEKEMAAKGVECMRFMKRNQKLIIRFVVVFLLFNVSTIFGNNEGISEKEQFDAHATAVPYFFDCDDMDFHFGNLVLGSAVNRGVEIGEAFWAAFNIVDGDAQSWQARWYELAQRVEKRGMAAFEAGHLISARDQFFRASYYYRISLISMLPDNAAMKERAEKSRQLFFKAGGLLDQPLEYVEVPYDDGLLPVLFRKAKEGNEPVRTLIMVGGGETFIEDLYFYIANQTHDREYNFVTLDLPGQGIMPLDGKLFRADAEVPMRALVDYVLSREDVDPDLLFAYGISGGGCTVPQAATYDDRIKAVAMNSGVVNAYDLFAKMPVVHSTKEDMADWTSFHRNVVKTINWRWGVDMDNPSGLVEANRGFEFDPEKLTVPTLLIVGEGEYRSEEVQRQQKIIMDNVQNDNKKMVLTPINEGASNHCVMENRSLIGSVLFDWLDEIVADKTAENSLE